MIITVSWGFFNRLLVKIVKYRDHEWFDHCEFLHNLGQGLIVNAFKNSKQQCSRLTYPIPQTSPQWKILTQNKDDYRDSN